MTKNFFSFLKKPFEAAGHDLQKATHFVGDTFEHFIAKPIGQATRSLEHDIKHLSPEDVGGILTKAGEGLEVLGAVTGQPELIAAGAGLGLIGGVTSTIGGIVDKHKSGDAKAGETLVTSADILSKLGTLAGLEESQNKRLTALTGKVEKVGNFVQTVEDDISSARALLREDIRLDQLQLQDGHHMLAMRERELKSQTEHNDTMKQHIQDNHGLLEAEKHQSLVLDNELQSLKSEERKEQDILNQIKTRIDRPSSVADVINDMNAFNDPVAIANYLAEQLPTLNVLTPEDRNRVFDLALERGVLNSL